MTVRRQFCAFTLPMPRERAFTLVELMIAAAITVVIVLVLGGMFLSLTKTSMRASQRIDAFRDARAALQMMERDLSNLVQLPPNSGNSPESAAYFALTTRLYPEPTPATNHQIYALCAMKNQPAPSPSPVTGDVCAVGYYCRWDTNPSGGEGHYVLCRYFKNSTDTFKTIQTSGTSATALYTPSASDEVLAAYVWNFRVTMYDATGNLTPSPTPVPYPSPDPYIVYDPTATANALPAAIEISFNAMSPQAARTVMSVSSSPTDWDPTTPTQTYQQLILPHMYQFRTRINLQ